MSAGRAAVVRGFVLAGGRSSRMGSDKALLSLDGEPLVARIARVVEAAAGSAVIVGDPQLYSVFHYTVIQDSIPNSGPLAGIEAALSYSDSDWNLIVACDMPGVTSDGLTELIANSREHSKEHSQADVCIPTLHGQAQPLCAMYHRRALSVVRAALLRRCLKIMDAIRPLRIVFLAASDETLFQNVNTPEEWSAFVSR
jgi:molybdopterin-guanine dinucleotide biosynthesis protein A